MWLACHFTARVNQRMNVSDYNSFHNANIIKQLTVTLILSKQEARKKTASTEHLKWDAKTHNLTLFKPSLILPVNLYQWVSALCKTLHQAIWGTNRYSDKLRVLHMKPDITVTWDKKKALWATLWSVSIDKDRKATYNGMKQGTNHREGAQELCISARTDTAEVGNTWMAEHSNGNMLISYSHCTKSR